MLIELQNVYLEHFSKEEVATILNASPNISNWAFILHDKDKNEHGLKKAHFHIGIEYTNSKHENLVLLAKEEFRSMYEKQGVTKITTQVRKVKSPCGFMEYLTHKNNPEKYQYSKADIVTNSEEWLNMHLVRKGSQNMKIKEFLNYLLEQNGNGSFVSDSEAMKWFMDHDMAEFYVTHQYGINSVLKKQLANMEASQPKEPLHTA